jgi:hypothetical protein
LPFEQAQSLGRVTAKLSEARDKFGGVGRNGERLPEDKRFTGHMKRFITAERVAPNADKTFLSIFPELNGG